MRNAPAFDSSPMEGEQAAQVATAFDKGMADSYPARSLVRAGLVKFHPLHGGIFWRREPVKYIVMHSTETGVPVSAWRVIEGWNSMGIRHPGAQYVVDRDGTIYQAVDPDLATVHVNIFKTLPGINNDNSIGIEINHTGAQDYPSAQMNSVHKLVVYLQNRYNVYDENIITHRYAQQGDHTDPVNFDWNGFIASKNSLRNQAIAYRENHIKDDSRRWRHEVEVPVNTYLKPHSELKETASQGADGMSSRNHGLTPNSISSPSSAGTSPYSPAPLSPLAPAASGTQFAPVPPAVPSYSPSIESKGRYSPRPESSNAGRGNSSSDSSTYPNSNFSPKPNSDSASSTIDNGTSDGSGNSGSSTSAPLPGQGAASPNGTSHPNGGTSKPSGVSSPSENSGNQPDM